MSTADRAPAAGALDPGSPGELARFAELQARLAPLFERMSRDPCQPRTVVVVPSLTLDEGVLAKIAGARHYEERLLCMLLLLRLPRTRIVYVTSTPVAPVVVEYYLQLLAGVPSSHARERLTLLACHDESVAALSGKVLARPRLMRRIAAAIGDRRSAHLSCFNSTPLERTLAVRLGIPLYGCDPALEDLGSKSGSREVFRAAGVPLPAGVERLRDATDLAEALVELRRRDPALRRAVVKLEQGFSGEGNAVFDYPAACEGLTAAGVAAELPRRLLCEAEHLTAEAYLESLRRAGGVVEEWVAGAVPCSPSVQCRIDPLRRVEAISTHDQLLAGRTGQVFVGCTFPARAGYRLEIQELALRIAVVLRDRGALGRFGVDFVSRRERGRWRHRAIEINLRKGGTTHTFRTLQLLTGGTYDPDTGELRTPTGATRGYWATDTLRAERYRSLTPHDLIDIAVEHELHFDGTSQTGTVFHLIGALSGCGKLGMVCVHETPEGAEALRRATVDVLDHETGGGPAAWTGPETTLDDLE